MGVPTAKGRRLRSLFNFPNPTNEVASRIVAAIVCSMCVTAIATGQAWLLIPITYGFWARALTGPKLSPASALASRLVAPLLAKPKPVAGPPKRFAQAIGAGLSSMAAIFWFVPGWQAGTWVALGILAAAAFLEAAAGFCLGCKTFAIMMRLGLIPQRVCSECADISLYYRH